MSWSWPKFISSDIRNASHVLVLYYNLLKHSLTSFGFIFIWESTPYVMWMQHNNNLIITMETKWVFEPTSFFILFLKHFCLHNFYQHNILKGNYSYFTSARFYRWLWPSGSERASNLSRRSLEALVWIPLEAELMPANELIN